MRALILACWALLSLAASDVDLSASVPWFNPQGWTPVVISGDARAKTTVQLNATYEGSKASTEIAVEPGKFRRTLLIPPSGANGRYGSRFGTSLSVYHVLDRSAAVSVQEPTHANSWLVVVGDLRDQTPLEHWKNATLRKPNVDRTSSVGVPNRIAESVLPDRWECYPLGLVLILAQDADGKLDAAQRSAVRRWLMLGGTLIVEHPAQIAAWTVLGRSPELLSAYHARSFHNLNTDRSYQKPDKVSLKGLSTINGTWFAMLAVLFTLIAGPGVWWYARRQGRPALQLVLIPLLGFSASLVMLGADMLLLGYGIKRSANNLVIVDSSSGEAFQISSMVYFAVNAQSSTVLDQTRWLRSDNEDSYRSRSRSSQYAWQWRDSRDGSPAVLSGELIPARVESWAGAVRLSNERGRILIQKNGNGYSAVNGFSVALRDLRWRDVNGAVWGVATIPAQGKADLTVLETQVVKPELIKEVHPDAAFAQDVFSGGIAGTWSAQCDAPLLPQPGPTCTDITPPITTLLGHAEIQP